MRGVAVQKCENWSVRNRGGGND